jgi:archaeal flagellin FlaB
MNLIKDEHGHSHRGVIGVESAIIIIVMVIVAAALAFVVLNMGISTTQKAKTTIISSLSEASSGLEVEGTVIAASFQPGGGTLSSLNITSIPIRIARGGDSVNLDPTNTAVKYLSNQITYDDIYNGTLNYAGTFTSLETATNEADNGNLFLGQSPFLGGTDGDTNDWPTETTAFIYWSVQSNTNDILEVGEHVNLVIVFAAGDRPQELDTLRIELILLAGSTLTVERQVPNITSEIVDLG